MLGRNSYTKDEFDQARKLVDQQLAAYKKLAKAVGATSDAKAAAARDAFEAHFFNNMVIVLDRLFVHRLRAVNGKDGNPLNEVLLVADSLINNGGLLLSTKVFKLIPTESVLKLEAGDKIKVTAAQFEKLAKAYFAEIEARFL